MTRTRSARRVRTFVLSLLGVTLLALITGFSATAGFSSLGARAQGDRKARIERSPHFVGGVFQNGVPTTMMKPGTTWSTTKDFLRAGKHRTPPAPLPVVDPRETWKTPPQSGLRATWLGHSSVLIELDGKRVLTDPMWSERASPSQYFGPKRFQPAAVPLDALPELDAVVISHDHYDHLDMDTVRALAKRNVPFFVPLGVGAHLEAWGVPPERIVELEWWQSRELPGTGLTITSTPSRHFSGRGMFDRNSTLWTSWVIQSPHHRVFFSGDTGLTPQFAEIRERVGPFDLVMLEIGAFHPNWGEIHLGPEQAVEAHKLLGGGPLLPIHWATFDLGLHPWDEPGEVLAKLADERGIPLLTPELGAPVEPVPATPTRPWWRPLTANR